MMENSKTFLINLQIWDHKSKTIWVKFIIWFAIIATMNGITTKV